jgi:hypothetical protein
MTKRENDSGAIAPTQECPFCRRRVRVVAGRFARHGAKRNPCCTSNLEAGMPAELVAAEELCARADALDAKGSAHTRRTYPALARRADDYRARARQLRDAQDVCLACWGSGRLNGVCAECTGTGIHA